MWQRFTEMARKVVFYAQEEAQGYGETSVSTEHLLLGLLREEDNLAMRVLREIGTPIELIRAEVEVHLVRGEARPSQDMTLTPRAKRVIDLAYDEARQLGNNWIGTEHLLLGLVREGDGLAGRVLSGLGVELAATRRRVEAAQEKGAEAGPTARPPVTHPAAPPPDPWQGIDPYARRVVVFGEIEALRRGQPFLSPEHLLLGLLREPESPAGRALAALGVDLDALGNEVAGRCRDRGTPLAGEATLSPASGQAFKIAYQERSALGAAETGAEHVLLGLLREPDGIAGRTLEAFGVSAEALRTAIRALASSA